MFKFKNIVEQYLALIKFDIDLIYYLIYSYSDQELIILQI